MNEFNEFLDGKKEKSLFDLVSSIAGKYDGKNQTELLSAIYAEAKKGKKNGTLSNSEIDAFKEMLAPVLDEKQRRMLFKLAEDLKKI